MWELRYALNTFAGSARLPPPDEAPTKTANPAGRIRHDSTGRAVWEWAADSGRHAISSTSRLLKRLDLPGLKVADYEPRPADDAPPAAQREETTVPRQEIPTFGGQRETDPLAHGQRGFNPYDARAPKRGAPVARKPAPPAKPRITQPPRQEKKPGWLARLFGRK